MSDQPPPCHRCGAHIDDHEPVGLGTCGRKACDDPTPLCVLCGVFGRRPRHVEQPQGCPDCRVRLAALPGDIADAHLHLDQLLEPRRGGQATNARRDEAPIPLAVDPYDLLADHTTPHGPIRRRRLSENHLDQIGHLPVAETLGTWVRDWRDVRDVGEYGAPDQASVGYLAGWLAERTNWAVDNHPAVDEYASELHDLRGVLLNLVGRTEPDERPKPITGVPCIRCHHVTLFRHHDGDVECQWPDCSTVWRANEYERITRASANAVRRQQVTIA